VRVHDFTERMAFSDKPDVQAGIEKALRDQLPSLLSVHKAHQDNDKAGVDYWLEFSGGAIRSVDVKARSIDYEAKGEPGLVLEAWSNIENNKIGWSRDPSKLCDYVLFYWHDTGRSYLADFRQLQPLFAKEWQQWRLKYSSTIHATKSAKTYRSEFIVMPTRDLAAAFFKRYCNAPPMRT